jgi:hypothetical protein
VVVDKSGQISAKLLSRWLYTHTVTTWGYFDCYPKGVNLDKKMKFDYDIHENWCVDYLLISVFFINLKLIIFNLF